MRKDGKRSARAALHFEIVITTDSQYQGNPLPGEPLIESIDVCRVAPKTVAPVPAVDQDVGRDNTELLVLSVGITDHNDPHEANTRDPCACERRRRG
jgi:hypothetical protein